MISTVAVFTKPSVYFIGLTAKLLDIKEHEVSAFGTRHRQGGHVADHAVARIGL